MKIEKLNSMKNLILNLGMFLLFVCFAGLSSAWGQNGQVPELVDVVSATKILPDEVQKIQDEISSIEQGGGTVDQSLRDKFQLYNAVNESLKTNAVGLTTFLAISGNSNYKLLKNDDEAFQDLLNGAWDEHMNDLIRLLTK